MFTRYPLVVRLLGLGLLGLLAGLILVARLGPAGVGAVLAGPVTYLYDWVIILSAGALLLGIAHVSWLHLMRILGGQAEWPLSLLLLVSLFTVLATGLLTVRGTQAPLMEWTFDTVIRPGQASLFALLIFFLLGAAYRLMRITTPAGRWMLAGALLILVVQMPLSSAMLTPMVGAGVNWLVDLPVMASVRGVLLGVALAAVTVGVRLFLQGGSRESG